MEKPTTKSQFCAYHDKTGHGVNFNFLLILLLLIPAFFAATASAATTTTMKHTPPDYFVADQRIQLETEVKDIQGVKIVRCYFKAAGEADFVFVPMVATGKNDYSGILPAPSAATTQIEYLFLAVNQANQVVRSQNFAMYQDANQKTPAWQNIPKEGEIRVSIELDKAPTQLMGFSDNVAIDVVESGARFGVVALLYHSATDSSSKNAVSAASSSSGTSSAGTITAGPAGWSTATIVGVGVGVAAVAGGVALAAGGGGGGGGGDGDGGEPEALTPTTILERWNFEGERRDGVRRSGNITFRDDGTQDFTVRDADGQSNGSGTGTWTLSGTRLTITFPQTISTLIGSVSGDSKKFILDTSSGSNHGIYDFTR